MESQEKNETELIISGLNPKIQQVSITSNSINAKQIVWGRKEKKNKTKNTTPRQLWIKLLKTKITFKDHKGKGEIFGIGEGSDTDLRNLKPGRNWVSLKYWNWQSKSQSQQKILKKRTQNKRCIHTKIKLATSVTKGCSSSRVKVIPNERHRRCRERGRTTKRPELPQVQFQTTTIKQRKKGTWNCFSLPVHTEVLFTLYCGQAYDKVCNSIMSETTYKALITDHSPLLNM